MKKILLSGVKPTGRPHIGNYFGAMKQFVDLQNSDDFDCFLFIADYHALNLIQNAGEMKQLTRDLVLDYLAIGLDPKKSILFKQSEVPAHTELAWIFDTIVTVPYLMRAHAFKAAVQRLLDHKYSHIKSGDQYFNELNENISTTFDKQNEELYSGINVGTFNYPVLMAADILLYNTDVVPVGQDQKQHIEYARDIADKFNHIFGETFKLPEPIILENVATVPGIDGRKMSKSYDNTIPLFATREEITKAVMSIVTDSGSGIPENVYAIHKLFRSETELKELYAANTGKYKILKDSLIEDVDAFIKPLREKREELSKNEGLVDEVLKVGRESADKTASVKLKEVKEKIGVL